MRLHEILVAVVDLLALGDLCDADTFVPGLAAASDADDAPEGE